VKQQAFYDELLERLRQLPRVRGVGAAITLPMDGDGMNTAAWLEGEPAPKPTDVEGLQIITPGYFQVLGVPIVAGRDLMPRDRNGAPRSVVVNEAFVRKHRLTPASVLGRRVRFSNNAAADQWTIVGVSRDVKHFGPALPPRSELFVASAQQTFGFMSFVARAEADPVQLAPAVRAAVAAIDPSQPITDLDTLQASLDSSVSQTSFLARLLTGFGLFALLLAAVGIYGVMNWSVVERRREIGVRIAVGARSHSIAAMVLRQGAGLLLAGLAIGAVASAGLTRLLSGLLFEVQPGDPITYASAVGVLSVVALVALWLPAHRASRVDAVAVLHE
jgi:predicted permease